MALPEKEYFKLNELSKLWNCTKADLIQFGATGKLIIHSDFDGYVIVDGIYKDTCLTEKMKFGQTIGRLFTFDLNINNPIAVHSPNLENIYHYVFKVPRKEHVKVHLQRAFRDTEQPITLELFKHYDVNVTDNYVSMLIPLNEFDHISISPSILTWLEDISVQMSLGMEQIRKEDIKKLITKERVQVEFLQPLKPGYFRCIAEGKNQELPWRSISELYVSRQSKNEFEKEYLVAKNEEKPNNISKNKNPPTRASKKVPELLNFAKYEINNNRQFTAFSNLIKGYEFDEEQRHTKTINKSLYNIFEEIEENYPFNMYVTPAEKGYRFHFSYKRGSKIEMDSTSLTSLQKYFTAAKEALETLS